MPTLTPLAYACPATTRKPAIKRRKLDRALDVGHPSSRALTDNSNVVALTPNGQSLPLCTKLSCSTCHRALSTVVRPGAAGLSMCSRCAAPTCSICARTCTSYTRPASFPPTPALTRSPSPSTMTPISPKRTALSLSYAAMNCDVSLSLPATKRKKPPVDKEEEANGELDGDSATLRDLRDTSLTVQHGIVVRDGTEYASVVPGCGRVVCRTCCVESIPNDGKLCVDCFALV